MLPLRLEKQKFPQFRRVKQMRLNLYTINKKILKRNFHLVFVLKINNSKNLN